MHPIVAPQPRLRAPCRTEAAAVAGSKMLRRAGNLSNDTRGRVAAGGWSCPRAGLLADATAAMAPWKAGRPARMARRMAHGGAAAGPCVAARETWTTTMQLELGCWRRRHAGRASRSRSISRPDRNAICKIRTRPYEA